MYTIKEVATLKEMYGDGSTADLDAIASKLQRSKRSIIAKLVNLELYKPIAKISKVTGEAPKTKAAYVKEIEVILDVEELKDLDKAPKQTLIKLKEALEEWFGKEEEEEEKDAA